jgi:hypothetical protein
LPLESTAVILKLAATPAVARLRPAPLIKLKLTHVSDAKTAAPASPHGVLTLTEFLMSFLENRFEDGIDAAADIVPYFHNRDTDCPLLKSMLISNNDHARSTETVATALPELVPVTAALVTGSARRMATVAALALVT